MHADQHPRGARQGGDLITELTPRRIDELVADGTISGGMLPKLAVPSTQPRAASTPFYVVDGRVPTPCCWKILTDQAYGTMIRSH